MRIISQNGKYDIPYEHFVFITEQNMIYAVSIAGSGTNQLLMAEYTRPKEAQKTIEMLHDKYDSIEFMKVSGTPETFKAMAMSLSEVEFNEATGSTFRFPEDDEIEVEE